MPGSSELPGISDTTYIYMKQAKGSIRLTWFVLLSIWCVGCGGGGGAAPVETAPQVTAAEAVETPERVAPATAVSTIPPTQSTATAATATAWPIEPCRLPAASFTNVGLGVPRQTGFVPSVGTIKAAVLFADFSDAPANETPSTTLARISPDAPAFFQQLSYGRMTLELQPHLQWLRLSQPSAHYATLITTGDGHRAFIQEAVNLADAAVDFSQANLVVVLANPEAAAIPYGPAFGAGDGFPGIEADGVVIPSGVTSGADLAYWGYLWLNHEMGHTMTLPDLYAYEDNGDGHRFVGTFGLMGLISGNAPEFFAIERWQLGWLDDGQIVCQTSGEQTTTLSAIEQVGGTKAVMVPTGGTTAVLVESRRALGFDTAIAKPGALVYTIDTATASGFGPIQVVPARANDPMRDQSPLAAGESYTHCNVTITVVEAGETGDTVRVTVNEQNPCAAETTQTDPCANVPAAVQSDVMVRFVNQSGTDVTVFWEESPGQLIEYFRMGDGAVFDQETYPTHNWVVQDASGGVVLTYAASAEATQCVLVP